MLSEWKSFAAWPAWDAPAGTQGEDAPRPAASVASHGDWRPCWSHRPGVARREGHSAAAAAAVAGRVAFPGWPHSVPGATLQPATAAPVRFVLDTSPGIEINVTREHLPEGNARLRLGKFLRKIPYKFVGKDQHSSSRTRPAVTARLLPRLTH